MDEPTTREDAIAKLREMIAELATASLTTMDRDGALRSRPMVIAELDEDGTLWFFTNDYSAKVEEVQLHPEVAVSFAEPERHRFVSISGTAELVRDPTRMQMLWQPLLRAWFPAGLDDPELALLKVEIVSAQYWDPPQQRLVPLANIARLLGTRAPADGHKLTLKHRIGSDTAT